MCTSHADSSHGLSPLVVSPWIRREFAPEHPGLSKFGNAPSKKHSSKQLLLSLSGSQHAENPVTAVTTPLHGRSHQRCETDESFRAEVLSVSLADAKYDDNDKRGQ